MPAQIMRATIVRVGEVFFEGLVAIREYRESLAVLDDEPVPRKGMKAWDGYLISLKPPAVIMESTAAMDIFLSDGRRGRLYVRSVNSLGGWCSMVELVGICSLEESSAESRRDEVDGAIESETTQQG